MSAFRPAFGYTTGAGDMVSRLLGLTGNPASAPASGSPTTGGSSSPAASGIPYWKRPGAGMTAYDNLDLADVHSGSTPAATPATGSTGSGLNDWANSAGMQFVRDQGIKALEGSRAGKGMLQSGGTGKALVKFGQNLGNTYLQQYMNNLFEHARLGIAAGGLVGSAGGWSKGTGQSSGKAEGEKKGLLSSIISAVAAGG